jgi:hypothetical protein
VAGAGFEDGYNVVGEGLGFLGRAPCPGAVGCAYRRGWLRYFVAFQRE